MDNQPTFVFRRFNDFKWLHSALVAEFPFALVPSLPAATYFGRFHADFVSDRQASLDVFLRDVRANEARETRRQAKPSQAKPSQAKH